MYKIRTKVMVALVLGLGFLTACSSNDDFDNGGAGTAPNGSTYMSVAINLATGSGTRADNQADTEQGEEPKNNFVGKWAGQDKIEKIGVYVFDGETLEAHPEFTSAQFQVQAADGENRVKITPSKGIKVNPGTKTVYVVVNPTAETTTHLDVTTLTEFKKKYGDVAAGLTDGIYAPTYTDDHSADVKTAADKVAEVKGNEDVITMTVTEPNQVEVAANVTEQATLNGDATNRAKLTVKRAVARVMVTTTDASFEVKGDDPLTPEVQEVVVGKVTDIKYVVGQSEKSLYFMQRAGGNENLTYRTPNSDFKPAGTQYNWTDVSAKYDYSGLWKNDNKGTIKGITVPTNALYKQAADQTLKSITDDLKQQLSGVFILPTTHKWGADQDNSDYRKNNTAYVLVRAKFTPKRVVMNDGSIKEDYAEGTTFYLGANGVFYESVAAARDAKHHGVVGQTAAKYENGKTLYYAWINPDNVNTGKWINSPVNRNNIYHIQISGFKRIGGNWNPLVPPTDPKKPGDPKDPNNPDPKPDNPNEPNDPPVNPDDPLTPKETWMSVQTTILPWNVHSYSVVLDM